MAIVSLVLAAQVLPGAFVGVRAGKVREELVYRNAGVDTVIKLPPPASSDERITFLEPSLDGKYLAIHRGKDIMIHHFGDNASYIWRSDVAPVGIHWNAKGDLVYALCEPFGSPPDVDGPKVMMWSVFAWERAAKSLKPIGDPTDELKVAYKILWEGSPPAAAAVPPAMRDQELAQHLEVIGIFPYKDRFFVFKSLGKTGVFDVSADALSLYDWRSGASQKVTLPGKPKFVRAAGEGTISVSLIESESPKRAQTSGFVMPGSAETYRTAIVNARTGEVTMVEGLAGAIPVAVSP